MNPLRGNESNAVSLSNEELFCLLEEEQLVEIAIESESKPEPSALEVFQDSRPVAPLVPTIRGSQRRSLSRPIAFLRGLVGWDRHHALPYQPIPSSDIETHEQQRTTTQETEATETEESARQEKNSQS